ncbi:GumC family protein [Tropicimonas aquimaris]|uniref:GumC family protein n=1 Tax=Tropicimonas aquimaris TaxID=914152 RepID=A0ABW3INJ0_9RHOB
MTDCTAALPDAPAAKPSRNFWIFRMPLRELSAARIFRGGRLNDAGRLPRYLFIFLLGAAVIWAPIVGYLSTAPLRFTSTMSLILPGSGASASVNLDRIGQASSFANSPFASSSVSPTETYKRLLAADRILEAAAGKVGMARQDFGMPRVNLVDQTSLIHVEVTGNSPEDSQARGDALLEAFFSEIDALRSDELTVREDGGRGALEEYRSSVSATREEISRLQRETGLINAGQYEEFVRETDALRARIAEVSSELSERTQATEALRATLGIDPRSAAATLKLHADSEFNTIIKEMSQHAATLAEAEGRYGRSHPALKAARDSHDATRMRALDKAVEITGMPVTEVARLDISPVGGRAELLARLVEYDSERSGQAAELAALQQQLVEADARVMDLIEPAARLEDLQRDFSVAEAVFASTAARSKTSKVDLFASYPLVQVLENPSLPTDPTSPKRMLAVAAGIAATMMLLFGLILGWVRARLISRLLADGKPTAPTSAQDLA